MIKELIIRLKYRDEMKLWEDRLRKGINYRVERAFLEGRIDVNVFNRAFDESFPVLLGWEIAEIKARVTKKK